MILAGDIGGTKTNLALFTDVGGHLEPEQSRSFPSRQYGSLEAIVEEFRRENPANLTAACFGIAGPVAEGRVQTTNLPWTVDAGELARMLGLSTIRLINDLEATAYGIHSLPEEAFETLNEGNARRQGTIAVIAAGTGLGEAALIWDGRRYRAISSEGGHADFAPRNSLEIELLRHLSQKFGHVSYERLLSGAGQSAIYQFLRDTGRGEEPAWLREALAKGDPNAVITEMALSGRSELCGKALDLFVSMVGAEAGNLALKFLAHGGVYVGGGIAPKILTKLRDGTFLKAFTEKGRLGALLSSMPVRVILEPRAALFGAARFATFPPDP